MGSGGFILGGLMSGVGKGLEMNALQARETALENLRNQRQIEAEGRAETSTIAKEGRAEDRDSRNDARDYTSKVGLLGLASKYKQIEGETEQAWKERIIRLEGEERRKTAGYQGTVDKDLAAFRSTLDIKKDAASQRLAAEIDSGEVSSIEQADDGELIKVMKDGRLVRSGVKGQPKERSAAAIEAEAEANRQEDRQREKAGLPPIDRSKKEAPKKTVRPSNSKPNGPWYQPGAGNSQAGTKTMTAKDIADTAKASGKTPEEVRAWAKANGYRET